MGAQLDVGRAFIGVVAMAALAACGGAADADGSATTAEIHCETWISRQLGIPTDDLQFEHRPTDESTAPSFEVLGQVVGGGRTLAYQCETTFDGDETWTLDNLDVVDVADELSG